MSDQADQQGTAHYGRGRGSRVEKRKRLRRHLRHALKLAWALGEEARGIAEAIRPFVDEDTRRSVERGRAQVEQIIAALGPRVAEDDRRSPERARRPRGQ